MPAKRAAFLPVAAVCLLAAGCVSLQPMESQLLQQSRYGELRQLMEERVKDPAASPTSELFYLCYAYSKVKRYNQLFPCLEHLQRNVDRGDDKLFMFDFSSAPALMRAEALMELGDFPKAMREAEKADALTRTGTYLQMRIYALAAAGLASALNGDPGQAEKFAAELETVDTSYPNTLLATDKYTGLAKIYMALKKYPRALAAIRKDEETQGFKAFVDLISGADLAGQSIFTYWELPKQYMLDKALFETGDLAAARAGFDKLLQMPQTQDNGDIYWAILFDRGRIAEAEGRPDQAVDFYRRAVEVVERQRATIHTEANKVGFVGDKQALYHRMVATLFSLGRHAEAFDFVERAKARALVDLLASRKQFAVRSGDPEQARALLANLEKAETEAMAQDAAPGQTRQRSVVAVQAREQAVKKLPVELASLVTVTALGSRDVQALLGDDETLLEYYFYGDELYAFALQPKTLKAARLEGNGLLRAIKDFRAQLESPQSDSYLRDAQRLYRTLIAPMAGSLNTRNLTVVPHGALHYVAFSALHSPGDGYLNDRHTLRALPSASVLEFLKEKERPKTGRALVLGNPSLDLKYAEQEARAVGNLLPSPEILLRTGASETLFKKLSGGFDYLHLATHGRFQAESPLSSGLLLAPDAENDGLLTLGELYTLQLNARLAALSACETGLGKVVSGDDLVGLTRGFLYAGARSIVASLWSVDDQATADLMVRFYGALGNMRTGEALRQAQLAVREKYPHPFYWAAFQLTGSGR
ncbi:MAG: CHAT domain-containing protein [Nitrospinae bacterium]|nr:CHAT domain-containing protein [Nitrospinota bacterium]